MELINIITQNNLPFTEEELTKIKNLATELEYMPKPTTTQEAELFMVKIKEFKIYASKIEDFVKEQVSKANQIHKEGVAKLKELNEKIKEAMCFDKVLEFANEELAKDSRFKLSGTTRKKPWNEFVYEEEEILKLIILDNDMLPFIKIDKKKFDKWLEENPESRFKKHVEIKEHKAVIK